jgi:hypothetical protein
MPRTRRQKLLTSESHGKPNTSSCAGTPDPSKPYGTYPIYSPLDLAKREMRLVQIKPSSTHNTLSCSLSVVSLDSKATYIALSYVWGDPTTTTTIIVNHHPFQATKNLVNALTRIRCQYSHDPNFYLWVDAICINQQEDRERSSQVQLMARIFNKASFVLSFLDSGNTEVDLGFRWIKVIAGEVFHACYTTATASMFKSFPRTSLKEIVEASNESGELPNLTEWLESYPSLCQMDSNDHLNTAWRSISAVVNNKYWRRVWIFQELLLAQASFFLAPERKVSISELCLVTDWISLVASGTIPCPPFLSRTLVTDLNAFIAHVSSVLLCHRLSLLRGVVSQYHTMDALTRGVNIFGILSATFDLDATDSRDHVYGCLGVTDASTEIFPDDSRPVGSVYCQWTRWLAAVSGDLSVIMMAGIGASREDTYRLPSWAPDWHLCSDNAKWTADPAGANVGLKPISKFNFEITEKTNALYAEGIKFGSVSAVERLPNNLVELASKPSIFIATYNTLRTHVHPTGDPPLRIFCRTLARDSGFQSLEHEQCPESVLNLAAGIPTWTIDLQNSDLCPGTSVLNLLQRDFFLSLNTVHVSGHQLQKSLSDDETFKLLPKLDHLKGSSFFWTADGYFGLTNQAVAPGDFVCVLAECPVPVIIRKEESQCVLVGICFLHGLMYGQAAQLLSEGNVTVERFRIQ